MPGIYDEYKLDDKAASDGAWVEFRGDLKIKIRSSSCMKVREWATKRAKKYRQVIVANAGILPPHMEDASEIAMCAEVLVVDWSGATDAEGNPLEFSTESVLKLITDLPSLRADIIAASTTEDLYRDSNLDAMGKTSAQPSKPISKSGTRAQ